MSSIEVVLRMIGAALAGYLLGSIPFGVLAGRFFGHRDPRAFGSGKTGATNVLRTLGPGPAAFVVVGDVLKGMAAVLLARLVFFGGDSNVNVQATAEALAGFCAILGHNYSVLIGFKGGRGVLTGAGAMVDYDAVRDAHRLLLRRYPHRHYPLCLARLDSRRCRKYHYRVHPARDPPRFAAPLHLHPGGRHNDHRLAQR